jgi:hypothetical protein
VPFRPTRQRRPCSRLNGSSGRYAVPDRSAGIQHFSRHPLSSRQTTTNRILAGQQKPTGEAKHKLEGREVENLTIVPEVVVDHRVEVRNAVARRRERTVSESLTGVDNPDHRCRERSDVFSLLPPFTMAELKTLMSLSDVTLVTLKPTQQ